MAKRPNPSDRGGGQWPWDEMELMLEHMFSVPKAETRAPWRLAVDVYEKENEFVIVADVPGLDADGVDVTLHGRTLTIRGELPAEEESGESICHLMERSHGAFERRVHLPTPVEASGVDAKCRNGVLIIRVLKPAR